MLPCSAHFFMMKTDTTAENLNRFHKSEGTLSIQILQQSFQALRKEAAFLKKKREKREKCRMMKLEQPICQNRIKLLLLIKQENCASVLWTTFGSFSGFCVIKRLRVSCSLFDALSRLQPLVSTQTKTRAGAGAGHFRVDPPPSEVPPSDLRNPRLLPLALLQNNL